MPRRLRQWHARLIEQAVLRQSILLHLQLALIDCLRLIAGDLRTKLLGWSDFRHLLLHGDARDHRVLVVVILFPGYQIILIHLLLNIGHIAVSFENFLPVDL